MGRIAQKRLVRKRDLERVLSKIEAHPLPKVYLEQYTTPSSVAAETLYLAAYVYDDIMGKTVCKHTNVKNISSHSVDGKSNVITQECMDCGCKRTIIKGRYTSEGEWRKPRKGKK